MTTKNEKDFMTYLESIDNVWDVKKNNCYLADKTTFPGATFYRAIGSQNTTMYWNEIFLQKYGDLPSDPSIKRINNRLNFITRTNGIKSNVNFRIEKINECIYVNQGNGKVIKVSPKCASILRNSKAIFEINDNLGPMVRPDFENGDLTLLKKYISVGTQNFKLILAFIFNAFFVDTHYVMLVLLGPAGSGKTFIQKVIKTVIDPCPIMLRNQFTKVEDLVLEALHCHLIDINNISTLSNRMQDVLCTILTGGVATTRKKFTDKEQSAIHTHNPIVINGIGNPITRDDLYERSIVIHLKNFKDTKIKPISEKQLTKDLQNDLPRIMGGIFNALSLILREFETFKTPAELNRMRDFHELGCVAEKALAWKPGSFTQAYNSNIAGVQTDLLECSPIAQAIIKMMKRDDNGFEGTFLKLKSVLSNYSDLGNITPRKLSADIDRYSDALHNLHGIKINRINRSQGGSRVTISFV